MSGQTRRYWTRCPSLLPVAPAHPSPALPLHPAFRELPPPVIVVGMHGSGSSLVSRILAELGVYMGAELDEHAEAAEFFALNEELLYRAGASWHRPEPFLARLTETGFRRAGVTRLVAATYGSLHTRYLSRFQRRCQAQWGWKDPRNSLTLPFWLQLFPHARILHILRDPDAAAESIHRRAVREASAAPGSAAPRDWRARVLQALLYPPSGLRALRRWAGRDAPFPAEDPCLQREPCQALAWEYVDACYRFRDLGGPRLEVRYEELLDRPFDTVQMLAAFTLGDMEEARIHSAAALVRKRPHPEVALMPA